MGDDFQLVPDLATLEDLLAGSWLRPLLVFNHDRGCSCSRQAYQEMTQVSADIAVIYVQRAHEVKRAVADQTGIRHESPQVILIRDGRGVWSAPHAAITAAMVTEALAHLQSR